MFGLAFGILLIILFSISTGLSFYKMHALDFFLNVIVLFVLIYTILNTIKSVF